MAYPIAERLSTGPLPEGAARRTADPVPLRVARLNIMRIGYLVMGVGLVFTKWPLIIQGTVATMPVFEAVVAVLLTAMSLLAFLGLRYPVAMLPVLMFETAWKLIWLATVGIPNLPVGDMSAQMASVFFSVCFVAIIIVVTPWDFVWKRFVRAPGDPWR